MARLCVLAVLAVFIASAAAREFFWSGATTEFNKDYNWEGGVAPSSSAMPSMTDMRTKAPFTSFVPEGTYNVGSVLKLPRNGRITFSGKSGATTSIKFVGNATGAHRPWKSGD
jgi:hypothetical protein